MGSLFLGAGVGALVALLMELARSARARRRGSAIVHRLAAAGRGRRPPPNPAPTAPSCDTRDVWDCSDRAWQGGKRVTPLGGNASHGPEKARRVPSLRPQLVTLSGSSILARGDSGLRYPSRRPTLRHGRRALAICAASAGVGCTFIAANLAVALSQIGVKTLLDRR